MVLYSRKIILWDGYHGGKVEIEWSYVISMCPLPLYLALLWKEKCSHALEYFDLQSVASTSNSLTIKPLLLGVLKSSVLFPCPVLLYIPRLSSDSSGIYSSWNIPQGLLGCCLVTASHNVRTKNLVFGNLLTGWLIDFWQQLNSGWHWQYSRGSVVSGGSVELSCSWKQGSPESPLATNQFQCRLCHWS